MYWSATWPREVEALARQFLQNPYKVCNDSAVISICLILILTDALFMFFYTAMQVTIGSPELKANHSIQQIVEVISDHEKYPRYLVGAILLNSSIFVLTFDYELT